MTKIYRFVIDIDLLLLTNEVWGKVMFSEVSVHHSVQGVSLYDVTICLATCPMFLPGSLSPRGLPMEGGGGLLPIGSLTWGGG